MSDVPLEWPGFAALIGEVAEIDPDAITRNTRLLEDLALDSFALSEVIALLLVDLGMATLEQDLAERDWRLVSVGALFDEYRRGESAPPRVDYVIRKRARR